MASTNDLNNNNNGHLLDKSIVTTGVTTQPQLDTDVDNASTRAVAGTPPDLINTGSNRTTNNESNASTEEDTTTLESTMDSVTQPLPVGSPLIIYTDGSCIDQSASGIGIFFGEDHPLNTSLALRGPHHNSGLAEIAAATTALRLLQDWSGYQQQPIEIRTDYLAVIDAMNNGNDGAFAQEYAALREIAETFPHGVTFQHVPGHVGEPGNEKADELARRATESARRKRSRSRSRDRNNNHANGNVSRSRSRSRSRDRNRSMIRNHRPIIQRSRSAHVAGRTAGGNRPVLPSNRARSQPPPENRPSRERQRSLGRGTTITNRKGK